MSLAPGSKLGPYEILSLIGAGGMGEVYQAEDSRLGRRVAIKTALGGFGARFEREARTIAALNHPNICTIHDVGEQDGIRYIAMELLEGRTLQERIGGHPLAPADAIEIALQVTAGLEAAHAKGMVHRDIKPANIFLTSVGQVKIMDSVWPSSPPLRQSRSGTSSLITTAPLVPAWRTPASTSTRSASRTVGRLMRICAARSRSEGSRSPLCKSPARSASRTCPTASSAVRRGVIRANSMAGTIVGPSDRPLLDRLLYRFWS